MAGMPLTNLKRGWVIHEHLPDALVTTSQFQRLYAKPKRAYHNWSHIEACLAELSEFTQWAQQEGKRFEYVRVQAAILYHDVIYDPKAKDNEERSADLAVKSLRGVFSAKYRKTVKKLILYTKHTKLPTCFEGRIIVDIDLSILGQPRAAFDAYEKAIRKEYAWVPDDKFRTGRAAVLLHFLKRKRIYSTPYFFNKYEKRARANLKRSLAKLL